MLQAESLVASGDAAEALPILEELVVDWPEHATLQNLLAVAYSHTGDSDRSLAMLEEAVKRAPEYYPLHLNLAGAYDDRGDYERALAFINRAIEIHPTFGVAHERKGVVLMRMGRYEEALRALDTATGHDARDPEVFYFAGVIESNFRTLAQGDRTFPAGHRGRSGIHQGIHPHGAELRGTASLRRRAQGTGEGGCARYARPGCAQRPGLAGSARGIGVVTGVVDGIGQAA